MDCELLNYVWFKNIEANQGILTLFITGIGIFIPTVYALYQSYKRQEEVDKNNEATKLFLIEALYSINHLLEDDNNYSNHAQKIKLADFVEVQIKRINSFATGYNIKPLYKTYILNVELLLTDMTKSLRNNDNIDAQIIESLIKKIIGNLSN